CYRIDLCSLVGFYNRQNKKTLRFFIKALAVSLKCVMMIIEIPFTDLSVITEQIIMKKGGLLCWASSLHVSASRLSSRHFASAFRKWKKVIGMLLPRIKSLRNNTLPRKVLPL